jgi:hypothetical protein
MVALLVAVCLHKQLSAAAVVPIKYVDAVPAAGTKIDMPFSSLLISMEQVKALVSVMLSTLLL